VDKIKGYKTLAFNAIMGALLLWKMLKPDAPVPEGAESMVTILLDNMEEVITVIGNILLRLKTNTAVGKSS